MSLLPPVVKVNVVVASLPPVIKVQNILHKVVN